jgi:Ca-activated chloride channel family protein
LAVLLLCACLPWQSVQAAELWRRPDQAAHARMQEATQAYRKGDFARAAQLYDGIDTATAHYNRGNALAKAGQYPQAIAAYDRALKQQRMDDALANRRAVEAAMKRKPPSGKKPGPQNPQPGDPQQPGKDGQPSSQDGQGGTPQTPQPPSPANPQDTPPPMDEPGSKGGPPQDTQPADAKAQKDADAAQRERMQRALQQAQDKPDQDAKGKPQAPPETAAQRERRIANEAWLKRVPDDPGGLLRAKFRIEYERRQMNGQEE